MDKDGEDEDNMEEDKGNVEEEWPRRRWTKQYH